MIASLCKCSKWKRALMTGNTFQISCNRTSLASFKQESYPNPKAAAFFKPENAPKASRRPGEFKEEDLKDEEVEKVQD